MDDEGSPAIAPAATCVRVGTLARPVHSARTLHDPQQRALAASQLAGGLGLSLGGEFPGRLVRLAVLPDSDEAVGCAAAAGHQASPPAGAGTSVSLRAIEALAHMTDSSSVVRASYFS